MTSDQHETLQHSIWAIAIAGAICVGVIFAAQSCTATRANYVTMMKACLDRNGSWVPSRATDGQDSGVCILREDRTP